MGDKAAQRPYSPPVEACVLVRKFSQKVAEAASGLPILDVACGSGRNAFAFQALGCTVICVDKDLQKIQKYEKGEEQNKTGRLILQTVDLLADPWPFGAASVGGILNVHFFHRSLLPSFAKSLIPGGYLLLETEPGCGGNYLQLPNEGDVKAALDSFFDFRLYKETRIGPPGLKRVTVKLLAKRKAEGALGYH